MALMRPSAARAATRKKAEPRSEFFRFARKATSGIRAISGRNCGIYSIPGSGPGETIRVFPLSNWTEFDIWHYIMLEKIPVVPLYFAKERPVVRRGGTWIMVDDERLPLEPGETPQLRRVRFRTLGCYPLDRRYRIRCRHRRGHRGGDADRARFGAARPPDRQRRNRFDGKEEAGGIFLMHAPRESPCRWRGGKDLLRFITCGSVDDGKSTLIGRLLHNSKLILEDQLVGAGRRSRSVTARPAMRSISALLVDGLEAEREQGITIDVAYRFFTTPQTLVYRCRYARA